MRTRVEIPPMRRFTLCYSACRVMRFIRSVISLKRSRVRAYSTVRAAHHCADASSVYRKALSASIKKITSTLLSVSTMGACRNRPQRRTCLKPTVTYVLAVRGASSDILFWALPDFVFIAWIGLCYCAGYIFTVFCGPYGNLRQIEMPPYRRMTAVRKTRLICL